MESSYLGEGSQLQISFRFLGTIIGVINSPLPSSLMIEILSLISLISRISWQEGQSYGRTFRSQETKFYKSAEYLSEIGS